jgi:TetR/AcrR family fatty acid metabolism transcriptional regulator
MKRRNDTPKKIYLAVEKLLEEKSANEISVQDICKCAGIGVGTFYHYYASKNEAIFDISNPIDYYFESVVAADLEGKEAKEQLRIFFHHQAQFMINFTLTNGPQQSLRFLESNMEHFHSKDRLTFQMLEKIVQAKTLFAEWKKDYSVEVITYHLLYLTRGAVSSWLGRKCSFDLEKELWKHVIMTKAF